MRGSARYLVSPNPALEVSPEFAQAHLLVTPERINTFVRGIATHTVFHDILRAQASLMLGAYTQTTLEREPTAQEENTVLRLMNFSQKREDRFLYGLQHSDEGLVMRSIIPYIPLAYPLMPKLTTELKLPFTGSFLSQYRSHGLAYSAHTNVGIWAHRTSYAYPSPHYLTASKETSDYKVDLASEEAKPLVEAGWRSEQIAALFEALGPQDISKAA
jgi:hypothetical protein